MEIELIIHISTKPIFGRITLYLPGFLDVLERSGFLSFKIQTLSDDVLLFHQFRVW